MFVNDFWLWNECKIDGSYPLLFRSPYTYIVKGDGPLRVFSEGHTFPFQTIIRMHKVHKAFLLQWQKVCK
jgi:hypothetical protein